MNFDITATRAREIARRRGTDSMVSAYLRLVAAASLYEGVRLSADEVAALFDDNAVETAAHGIIASTQR